MHRLTISLMSSTSYRVAAELLAVGREHFFIIGIIRYAEAVLFVFDRKEIAYCDDLFTFRIHSAKSYNAVIVVIV